MPVTRKTKADPSSAPDVGVLAREAVISFLHDASKATADREALRAGVAANDAEAAVTAPAGNAAGDGASKAVGIPAPAPAAAIPAATIAATCRALGE